MSHPQLLVLAPLAVEARALRTHDPRVVVERCGAGSRRAAATLRRLGPITDAAAVAVMGVAGGLDPRVAAGDLVVADRVVGPDGTTLRRLPSAALLSAALAAAGLQVHTGPVVTTPRVVHGAAERRELAAASGALVVDIESATLVAADWQRPLAVIRAVADTAGRELFSPRIVRDGVRALAALRRAVPVVAGWATTAGPRRVLLASPRASCAGVERAVRTVERALELRGAPVYVRRQIVHNRHVVADLEARGAVFVEELEAVPDGATVVFSAHGVSPTVRSEAGARALSIIDATCPLVAKVHSEVRRFAAKGYQVVLVGHREHDEVEGTVGEADNIAVITSAGEVAGLAPADPTRVAYATQTTLATDETRSVIEALTARFPSVVGPHAADICYATQNRQDAVRAIAAEVDLVLVVGSTNSSNTTRLAEVARRCGTRAEVLDDAGHLDLSWLAGAGTVGLTAGASAPEHLVRSVIEALRGLGPLDVEERAVTTETVAFPLPVEVR